MPPQIGQCNTIRIPFIAFDRDVWRFKSDCPLSRNITFRIQKSCFRSFQCAEVSVEWRRMIRMLQSIWLRTIYSSPTHSKHAESCIACGILRLLSDSLSLNVFNISLSPNMLIYRSQKDNKNPISGNRKEISRILPFDGYNEMKCYITPFATS